MRHTGWFMLSAALAAFLGAPALSQPEYGRYANRTALWERRGDLVKGFDNMYQFDIVHTPEDVQYPFKAWFFGWMVGDCNPGYPGCDAICAARSRSIESGWEVYAGPGRWDDGTHPGTWVPVITADDKFYDEWHNGDPAVVKVGERYFIAYSSTGDNLDRIGFGMPGDTDGSYQCVMGATSGDGIHWRRTSAPILEYPEERGKPRIPQTDAYLYGAYARPSLMRDEGKWKLWFDYWAGPPGGVTMGYAENTGEFTNPADWHLIRGGAHPALPEFPNPDVVKVGPLYYGYADPSGYEPHGWAGRKIAEAVSLNGVDWVVLGYVEPEPGVPATHVPQAFVWHEDGKTWMYLTYACQRGGEPYDYRYDRIAMMRREITPKELADLEHMLRRHDFAASGADPTAAVAPSEQERSMTQSLSELPPATEAPVSVDWLVSNIDRATRACRSSDGKDLVLTNGLVSRSWRLEPNCATVAYDNLMTGTSVVRGVKPEARITVDGAQYDIGGLVGQVEYGYMLPEWVDTLTADEKAFRCTGFSVGPTHARLEWPRKRYNEGRPWPPPGASVVFTYEPPAGGPSVAVTVEYEMYDGIPLLAKRIVIRNKGTKAVHLDTFTSEILAAVEHESGPDRLEGWTYPDIHVETDHQLLGGGFTGPAESVHWVPDPQYTSQVDYELKAPVMLECRPSLGPSVDIEPGGELASFRTFELLQDSTERERKGLAVRRMYRVIAPWVTENPIIMHVRQADPDSVKLAIDQCAEVGFEMVIMTFWSGFDPENTDPVYMAQIKGLVDYAHSKGIELGGYSLLASRSVGPDDDVINPQTGTAGGAIFGNSPCLCSRWGEGYFAKLRTFFATTGLDLLEHDGSYPGDACASTTHPGHRGWDDSQWRQREVMAGFYAWCLARGVYLNVPDWHFLSGQNKTAMGYREVNWSLPRERQVILGRQNLYDGTWSKTPSMGWMFLPLVEYHGGGDAATLEPLSEHLAEYGAHLAQNFGAGVQACYRGLRLYDTDETKAVVRRWVDFYKRHREILDSDIIHVRRPDGRDLDYFLHVNPGLAEKGLAMVFNPTERGVTQTLRLPLYYTGLTGVASIRERDGAPREYRLARDYSVEVPVTVPARGATWLVIQ